jgi:hypothetical protein
VAAAAAVTASGRRADAGAAEAAAAVGRAAAAAERAARTPWRRALLRSTMTGRAAVVVLGRFGVGLVERVSVGVGVGVGVGVSARAARRGGFRER